MCANRHFRVWYGFLAVAIGLAAVLGLSQVQAQGPTGNEGMGATVAPLGTAFTFQGYLTEDGAPANGTYDFRFTLYDSANGNRQVGTPITLEDVSVRKGVFTVMLDFGTGAFTGEERYLQVEVRPGASTGAYTRLSPRQRLTAAPYALFAHQVPWSGLIGVPAGFADGVDNDTTYSAGTGLTLSGTTFALNTGYTDGRYWKLGGNAGTDPATNFLGTMDNVTLTLRVNNTVALRLVPTTGTPNVIGGFSGNAVTPGVVGATIGGGGAADDGSGNPAPNRVTDDYGTVGGGWANQAGDDAGTTTDAGWATVGGGFRNTASGPYATVGGGESNTASGSRATVGGGDRNTASGALATVGGGALNTASGFRATVSGGESNTARRDFATVGGGLDNTASAGWATVGGGFRNTASGPYATVGGGLGNTASGGSATVGGGRDNTASGSRATVGGGGRNTASGFAATVPGGSENTAAGAYSFAAGRQARALHDGTFVWSDSSFTSFDSTAPDQFLIRASGGVGIGTNAPQNQLHVVEYISDVGTPQNHVVQIENTAATDNADVLALKIGYTGTPGAANNYITFFKGDNTSAGAIQGNGSGGVVLAGPGSDYAEWLPKVDPSETLEPGDIVGLFPDGVSKRTRGALRVLVVSTGAIVAGNDTMDEQARQKHALVAFIGQVWVKVRGPVQVGDYIVPSGKNDGTGIAVRPADLRPEHLSMLVGRVWEVETPADGKGLHRVRVAVGLPAVVDLGGLLRMKEQRIEALEQRIAALEARLAALEQGRTPTGRLSEVLPGLGLFALLAGLVLVGRRQEVGR